MFSLFNDFAWDPAEMAGYVTIMDALPPGIVVYILKMIYCVNLFFSYPLQLTPAVDIIESFIFPANVKVTTGQYWG